MSEAITLTSLAMLKVNLDLRNQDYLDYLVPFVIHVLNKNSPDVITDSQTSQWILDDFGLIIPAAAVQLVLRRLTKRKLLKREHGVYFIAADLPEQDIRSKRAEAKRHIDNVLNALREYAQKGYSTNWTKAQANDLMLAFLAQFSIDCLRTYARGTALPEVQRAKQSDWYIINSFIKHIHINNLPLFESMIILVKAHMLANALICPDLESFSKNFKKVVFYFDTPILLSLLQLHGESEYKTSMELLQILQNLGAKIAMFEHTADEVHKVITGCAQNIDNSEAFGTRITYEMRRQGKTKSDLLLLLNRLDENYSRLDISQKKTPSYKNIEFQIDELELEAVIDEELQYFHPQTKKYDINSVRSIYVLRSGSSPIRIEDATAVFVTANTNFARAAYRYGKEHKASKEVSSVVTDFALANVAWLKTPLGAPDLPKSELIATSYAALEPGNELWSKYLEEIEKLETQGDITSRDHEVLRYSLVARDELMYLTLGSEEALTVQTVTGILEKAEYALVKEEQALLEKEKKSHQLTKLEKEKLEQQIADRNKRWYWVSERWGTWSARIVKVSLVTLLIIFVILLGIPSQAITGIPLLYNIIFIGIIFMGIWGGLNLYCGLNIKNLCACIQRNISKWIYRRLTRIPANVEKNESIEPNKVAPK